MLPICVRTERVWPKLSSIQGIRANLVYIVSLVRLQIDTYTANTVVVLKLASMSKDILNSIYGLLHHVLCLFELNQQLISFFNLTIEGMLNMAHHVDF